MNKPHGGNQLECRKKLRVAAQQRCAYAPVCQWILQEVRLIHNDSTPRSLAPRGGGGVGAEEFLFEETGHGIRLALARFPKGVFGLAVGGVSHHSKLASSH